MRVCKKCGLGEPQVSFTERKSCCRGCDNARRRMDYLRERGGVLVRPGRGLTEEEKAAENRKRALAAYHENREDINRKRNKPLDFWFRKAVINGEKIYQDRRDELLAAWQSIPILREKCVKRRAHARILKALRRRLQAAFRYGADYSRTALELLGCGIPEFRRHIESLWQPGMTWDNYGYYGWHFDHIIPCAKFDLRVLEQRKKCFHYTNMQPLWADQNFAKRDGLKLN